MHVLDQGISIGPLGFSLGMLLFLLAATVALACGAWLGRRQQLAINDVLFNLLLVGLIGARLVFVLRYFDSFGGPLAMIDIRDRGFDPVGGLIAAAFLLGWMTWRDRKRLVPVLMAGASGLLVWSLAVVIAVMTAAEVERLPDTSALNLDGEPVSLAALGPDRNRPLVINVWATWCPPCRREMPVFERAQHDHENTTFILLNQGEDAATVRSFLQAQGLAFDHVLLDRNNEFSPRAGVRVLPTTLFYDDSGELERQHVGELSGATLKSHLESLQR